MRWLVFLLWLVPAAAHSAPWAIVQDETKVEVTVRYLGAVVILRFDTVLGTIDFDENRPDRAKAAVTVASGDVETGLGFVNAFVTGPDWLNAQDHPQIDFQLDRLVQTSESTADVFGQMTFLGVTRPVDMKAVVFRYGPTAGNPRTFDAGFTITGEIDRRAFGHTTALGQVPAILPVRIQLLMRSL